MKYNQKWTEVEPTIRAIIEELDRSRQQDRRNIFTYGTLMGVVAALLFLAIFGPFALALIPACWVLFYIISHIEHNRKYKSTVVPSLVQAVCPGATYNAEGDFPKDIIKASKLYPAEWGEHYKNEDTIRGKIGNTDFVYGEMKLSHTQHTGKSSVEVTDFEGFAFEADFNKYFQGMTVLSSERMHLMGQVGGIFSNMKHIELEDVRFNDRYRTYTTNDQEARYILSPALQERIMQMDDILRAEVGGRELSMSFHDSRLLIMVQSGKDRFEVKYDLDGVREDFIAFSIMVDIIEQLNLNLRIWTKE